MRIDEIMTRHPLSVGPDEDQTELRRLAALGRVHHLPLIDGGRLVGMWVASPDGSLVMVEPEQVHQTKANADAEEAIEALLGGKQAVLAWGDDGPTGVVTKADVMAIIRSALARGIGRRHDRPVVVRLAGPADAGKGSLVIRTVPLLRHVHAAVVRASPRAGDEHAPASLHGMTLIEAPEAHWRAGLHRALDQLADVQLVLVEDVDGPAAATKGIGEDHQVLVVSAAGLADLVQHHLSDVAALVVTRIDEGEGTDIDAIRARVGELDADLPVFAVAAERDDRGLDEWRDWLLAQVLPAHR